MKTIFRKEWRENFKFAVIGFAIYTFMLVSGYRACSQFYEQLAGGQSFWQNQSAQPLLSQQVLSISALFCAIFGAVLGWIQIHNERHRDLWAYLVHRPISRTKIFSGKVLAGLCLYAVGAGIPLAGFMVMAAIPGHFPVPFQGKMLLPLTATFLSGLVYYLGGMLTGVRQARWYASRGLGLGAGIIISALVIRAQAFWQVVIFLVPALIILGLAAWGSFVNNAYYEGQPKSGRRALTAALMLGCFVVVNFALMLLMSLRSDRMEGSWTRYQITTNGVVYKITGTNGKPTLITDLNGVTLTNKDTGRPMLQNDLNRRMTPPESFLSLDFETNSTRNYYARGFGDTANYFSLWRQTPETLWYWCSNGRLWGYDIASRRFIGTLGPSGFAAGVSAGPDRFSRLEGSYNGDYYNDSYPARTLMTDTAIYALDYENHTSRPFFTTTNNERISGAIDLSFSSYGNWDYTLLATTNAVRIMTPDGKCYRQASLDSLYPLYSEVIVYFLSTNEVVFWFNPNYQTNQLRHWKVPTHVEWVAGDQSVVKTLDLPSRPNDRHQPWTDRLGDVIMPPASYVIAPLTYPTVSDYAMILKYEWKDLLISLAASVVFAGVGWALGRRYDFSIKDQVKWAVFNLLFSLPGLLAFIFVQEWPARVVCPQCKQLRRVDREHCEHCGAEAEAPAKNGTEIFEKVGVN